MKLCGYGHGSYVASQRKLSNECSAIGFHLLQHRNSFQAIFFNFRAEGANFLCNFRRKAA
jgi:hypothetical protein